MRTERLKSMGGRGKYSTDYGFCQAIIREGTLCPEAREVQGHHRQLVAILFGCFGTFIVCC